MRRRGFSIAEVLIAGALSLTVLALVFHLWMSSARGVGKGEETLTSVQDASLVLLYLRRDLQRLILPTNPLPWHVRYVRQEGTEVSGNSLLWDPARHSLLNTPGGPDTPATEDVTELSFYASEDTSGRREKITYRYFPKRKVLERTKGGSRPHLFGLPRMQNFQIQFSYTDAGGLEHALFGADTPETGRILQFWFRIRFQVQGEDKAEKIRQTRIDLETRIFPRYANRGLHSRWIDGS
jgi:hypothetical protein